MAVMTASALGRPRGKIGNIVFGSARSRTGKIVTARSLVRPANPNTAAQQTQRSKFSDSVFIMRHWGTTVYQSHWNRAIGQLPGFQSGMSILLDNMDETGQIEAPPNTPLGPLHIPDTLDVVTGAAVGTLDVTWSNEVGIDGTAADIMRFVWCPAIRADRSADSIDKTMSGESRASSPYTVDVNAPDGTLTILAIWLTGQGLAAGIDSEITWFKIATGS